MRDSSGARHDEKAMLARVAREAGIVLLYHGLWSHPPAALVSGLHNVTPTVLERQLELVKTYFTVVSVDEFSLARDVRGLAAVSFDDGYRCINTEALPVFEALNVPFTVYVNGASFRGAVFWRDQVRFIDESGLRGRFEAHMQGIDRNLAKRFYRYTKHPGNNSQHVAREIARFLDSRGVADQVHRDMRFCFSSIDELLAHPLVSYGNHSESHFVMSSLSADQQFEEIQATSRLLGARRDINRSELFSIPFGDVGDFNRETMECVRGAGYRGVLLSRGRVHRGPVSCFGMSAIERFMPRMDSLLHRVNIQAG